MACSGRVGIPLRSASGGAIGRDVIAKSTRCTSARDSRRSVWLDETCRARDKRRGRGLRVAVRKRKRSDRRSTHYRFCRWLFLFLLRSFAVATFSPPSSDCSVASLARPLSGRLSVPRGVLSVVHSHSTASRSLLQRTGEWRTRSPIVVTKVRVFGR